MLVLDAPPLHHFALIDRLDVLRDLLIGWNSWSTTVVLGELKERAALQGIPRLAGAVNLDWLTISGLDDSTAEIRCFLQWVARIGEGNRNLGEASVFALAELRSATAITDDDEAKRVARGHGIDVHGTMWLLANACADGKITTVAAGNLIDSLRESGHRLPCTGHSFPAWCRSHGLL
jgi:predicted nucleic acid-binding protein